MADIDPNLKRQLNQSASSPTFDGSPTVDPIRPPPGPDPRTTPTSPDAYWDPSSGRYEYLGVPDPGSDAGRYALHNALNDASSAASNMYYYGGSSDFANNQADYFNAQAQQLAKRAGPQADFNAGTGSYNQMMDAQRQLGDYLSNVANNRVTTPAETQLLKANAANQAGISAQLASARGGLAGLAAANSASRTASETAGRKMNTDLAVLRTNQSLAAQDQLAGLTNAMRTQEVNRAQDVARLGNLNTIRNKSAAADANNMSLGALSRGLEGNMARQQARMDTYNTAVGNADKYAKFNTEVSERNLAGNLGAARDGAVAIGQLYSEMNRPESKKP